MQLRILAQALAEAEEAIGWYQRQNVQAALDLRHALDHAIASIVASPEMHGKIDEKYRECIVQRFPYAIYFQASAIRITVFAISHTSREPDYWRGRR